MKKEKQEETDGGSPGEDEDFLASRILQSYGAGTDRQQGLFEFQREYSRSKEPLRMDLLIIRKLSEVQSANEIGHILKKYNIAEFKNLGDRLSIFMEFCIWVFIKVS